MDQAAIEDMIARQYIEAVQMRKKHVHPLDRERWRGAIITLEEQMENIRPGQQWPLEVLERESLP